MSASIASLIYDARAEKLTGAIGIEQKFDLPVYSGGSRGHRQVNPETAILFRHFEEKSIFSRFANSQTIGKETKADPGKQRGGTFPPGHYSCDYTEHPAERNDIATV
jgi:hypothetical protein